MSKTELEVPWTQSKSNIKFNPSSMVVEAISKLLINFDSLGTSTSKHTMGFVQY
jgi:hypothetical protein